ncbi:hypothetical protein Scep_016899 [Stephania cephalantha]|uniref:Uncharacterized protein n=1 Tax=Stephania cephalantha TaxID=152367 RepID=A0AAP0INL6_9MAGN
MWTSGRGPRGSWTTRGEWCSGALGGGGGGLGLGRTWRAKEMTPGGCGRLLTGGGARGEERGGDASGGGRSSPGQTTYSGESLWGG